MRANRSMPVGCRILANDDVLRKGQETASYLWNTIRHLYVGNWSWLRYACGPAFVISKRPPYPGNYGMQSELQSTEHYRGLASRCAEYTVKDFDIAMRSWFSNLRSNPRARPPRKSEGGKRTLTFEIGRNAKHLGDWRFRLTVLGGHIEKRHCEIVLRVKDGIKVARAKLIRIKPDGATVICFHRDLAEEAPGTAIAAIDLGVANLAAVAFSDGDTILYPGGPFLDVHRRGQSRAAKCKPSGWSGKGERNSKHSERRKAYLSKARNTRSLMLHNLTRSLVDECARHGVGTVVVGDLANLKNGSQNLAQWLRGEFVRRMTYKGEEVGIEVAKVSEAYTSRTCHACGSLSTKRTPRGVLTCEDCGTVCNSDINGAWNIMKRYLRDASLGVGADLPGPPSPAEAAQRIGESDSQMHPTYVARFDFRDAMRIKLNPATTASGV